MLTLVGEIQCCRNAHYMIFLSSSVKCAFMESPSYYVLLTGDISVIVTPHMEQHLVSTTVIWLMRLSKLHVFVKVFIWPLQLMLISK